MKLSILIPTFNEEHTIEEVVRRIQATAFPVPYELIMVDDRSRDRTFAIEQVLTRTLSGTPVTLLRNAVNKGKGGCIHLGLTHATGDWVIIQDGDLEYHPRDIPALLQPILDGKAPIVFGSRFLARRWPQEMAWPNFLANRLLTWLANRLYGLRLSDLMTGYKVMPRELLQRLGLKANRFEFEGEVAAKLARTGAAIVEVPITYQARTVREGKKIRAQHFFLTVWTLLRYRG